jgi:hypothetical protein
VNFMLKMASNCLVKKVLHSYHSFVGSSFRSICDFVSFLWMDALFICFLGFESECYLYIMVV